ncbi:DUF397 domain-containing protein [Streptomyces glaucus]|uniref:DUF397 domain-containing protein n=1 Tax=Streptomyces glaucus TaxID=284029 RepID=UPI0031CDCC92
MTACRHQLGSRDDRSGVECDSSVRTVTRPPLRGAVRTGDSRNLSTTPEKRTPGADRNRRFQRPVRPVDPASPGSLAPGATGARSGRRGRKSSRSSNGGDCVGVARLAPRTAVRDSRNPGAGTVTVSPEPSPSARVRGRTAPGGSPPPTAARSRRCPRS